MKFKDRLRELRKQNNVLQSELAKTLNIRNTTVSAWENGVSEPEFETLIKIANYFNVSTDFLLGLEDEYGNKIDNNGDMYVKVVARSKGNTVKPHYEKLTPEDIKLFEEIIAKLKKE